MPAQASTPVALTVKPVRIVIADDHPVFMDGFCAAVRKHKEVAIVGRAHNGLELLTLVEQLQPDVVFTDIKMPVMDGIAATNQIRQRFPGVKVIALSGFTEDCFITDMMIEAKASGYMVKETPKEEILKAIDMVMRGEIYCSGEVMTRLVALAQRTSSNPMKPLTKPSFTQRELMVMIENTNELSCKEIAKKLNLDVSSVESAKKRLFEKTNCRNSVGLAIYAIRNFIIRL